MWKIIKRWGNRQPRYVKNVSYPVKEEKLIGLITGLADEGEAAAAMYLDFCKAFDTPSHDILTSKLQKYGVDEITLGWVVISASLSDCEDISTTTLQGSVLSPVLDNSFISGLEGRVCL